MGEFYAGLPDWIRWFWAAQQVKGALLMLAACAQVLLTLWVYDRVGSARMRAGREGRITANDYRVVGNEPEDLALHTRALANQFELPVLFYATVMLALASLTSWLAPIAAWAFVALRVAHIREMLGPNRVMRRRRLFLYSMAPIGVLLAEIAFTALVTLWFQLT